MNALRNLLRSKQTPSRCRSVRRKSLAVILSRYTRITCILTLQVVSDRLDRWHVIVLTVQNEFRLLPRGETQSSAISFTTDNFR